MPDDPAFIRMIAATPDDDAPRLVYADVLEERGDAASVARAEFIRVQCERARLVPDSPPWRVLWRRDADLLDWARKWRAELPTIDGIQYGGFHRGFIDRVRAPAAVLQSTLKTLQDALPIRGLVVDFRSEEEALSLSRSPEVEEMRELALEAQDVIVNLRVLRRFADRGPWFNLQRLQVRWKWSPNAPMPGSVPDVREQLRTKFGHRLFER
jgi:uncharacterized protein (TIGR02996 family)